MPYPEYRLLSPNRDDSRRHEAWGVLFHHTELGYEETIARMMDSASRVSYHVVIAADGRRCQLVPDESVAWHAGLSHFAGRDGCNDFMLGLSFEGDTALRPLTEAQIASAIEWLELRWAARGWSIERIADHRQVAPGRKRDLEPCEWNRLRLALIARFGTERPFPEPVGENLL
jgi:AmpD protein